jgi:hypothetical protein
LKPYGIIAEFESPAAILEAAKQVRTAGYRRWDVFSPFPIHGIDQVMGMKNSKVGLFSLAMGAGAFLSVMGLLWFANAFDYPLIVGGKPMFSVPMSVVPSYILTIMGGSVGALVGMLALNQLPRWYSPLFNSSRFALISRDKFMLVIGANDEKFSVVETRKLLETIGGKHVEIVEEDEA